MKIDKKKLSRLIRKGGRERNDLIALLYDIQNDYSYLPKEALLVVSEELNVSLNQLYQIATFFRKFHLKPRGRHLIRVCVGTACQARGAERINDKLKIDRGLEPGGTTKDKRFTLETVDCLGVCGLSPVMVVDEEYFGKMTSAKVDSLLKEYR